MLILEIAVVTIVLGLLALFTLHQILTMVREYRFYRANGWNFSVDSGLDRVDERIAPYRLPLTNWQRLFLFRPAYILMLLVFSTMMVASLF